MEDKPNNTQNNRGIYVGVQEEEEDELDTEDDGLGDIWKEMSMAIECSKVSYLNLLYFFNNNNCLWQLVYHLFIWMIFACNLICNASFHVIYILVLRVDKASYFSYSIVAWLGGFVTC